MSDELRCPKCGSTNCECQPRPHIHRCLDCGYDGHRPKGWWNSPADDEDIEAVRTAEYEEGLARGEDWYGDLDEA